MTMTDTEAKALALVNEFRAKCAEPTLPVTMSHVWAYGAAWEALCRVIEQHEAFRQEVSDAMEVSLRLTQGFEGTDAFKAKVILERFIIAKPDPLVEVFGHENAEQIRAAIEKRGGKITWGEG